MTAPEIVRAGLERAVEELRAREEELGQLDAVAGDGDHGSGVLRGFLAARAEAVRSKAAVGPLLIAAGTALADEAGGASGALYGELLQGVGTSLGADDPRVGAPTVARALRAGLDRVQRLGNAEPGDKTMVDVLHPFVVAFERAAETGRGVSESWDAALPAAHHGLDATVDLVARKGRAATLGERARGHADPGATSLLYVLTALGEVLASQCSA